MKNKFVSIFILVVIFIIFAFPYLSKKHSSNQHRILKVIEADTFYIDLNDNNEIDNDELIKLKDVHSFYPLKNQYSLKQADYLKLNIEDYVKVGFLARNWARDTLVNKLVFVDDLSEYKKDEKYRYSYIKFNSCDLGMFLLENGLGYVSYNALNKNYYSKTNIKQVRINAAVLSKLDWLIVNLKNNTAHKLDCEFGKKVSHGEIFLKKQALLNFSFCKICLKQNKINQNIAQARYDIPKSKNKYLKSVYKRFDNIELYLINPLEYKKPNKNCETLICKRLVDEIGLASETIDLALYGIGEQEDIINSLKEAQKRGIKIRAVVDYSLHMDKIYPYTTTFIKEFQTKTDKNSIIMHNKFFIFDNKKVLTGSVNVSPSGTGGYNSNLALVINSSQIAHAYKKEFEQMYKGRFSNKKEANKIITDNNVSVYFSPKNNPYDSMILNEIKNAKNEIFISIFYLTDKDLINELIKAKKRNVNVLVLMDALCANSFKERVYLLRKASIPTIVENWGGKNHEKTMVIDSSILITGSANFSKSGFYKNDENVLLIKNSNLADLYRDYYLYLFNSIDKKFLKAIPRAEGFESVNSCYDGIDNNFDGKIDSEDEGCRFVKAKK